LDGSTIQHRVPAEGADYLLLAGVNDQNLQELARMCGCRVLLRGDDLVLSGQLAEVERAVPVAQHMVELARMSQAFGPNEIRQAITSLGVNGRIDSEFAPRQDGPRIFLPGSRKVIVPKSEGQRLYLDNIEKNDIVVGIGPAGTGKTYLAVAMAVDALRKSRVKRIILARPAVEAGENLGFLPGDLQEKVDPYLRPLYDALDDMMPTDGVRRALESRTIEIAPLAYMRGRTLSDAFVILDEAQNATREQMKMFLTRLGLNSRTVITGDKTQIDLPRPDESGLLQIEAILRGIDGIAFSYLDTVDVVRHRLVKDIIRAYASDTERSEEQEEEQPIAAPRRASLGRG
jgi:phosphate starvation-inducible protein PhoH and related proteins